MSALYFAFILFKLKKGFNIRYQQFLYFTCLLITLSCSLNDSGSSTENYSELDEIASFRIEVPEPSGLCLHSNGKSLWTVSDQTAKVYRMSREGFILKTLTFTGTDLEGISQSPLDNTIWVVEERSREIVQLDTLGTEINRYTVNVDNNDENSGLEGVAVNPLNGQKVIANEKIPLLIGLLNHNGQIVDQWNPDFVKDCSGIEFESSGEYFWIVSDESKTVVKCDLQGQKIASYKIDVEKAEGIAVSLADSVIYIVSDSEQKLYKFKMP